MNNSDQDIKMGSLDQAAMLLLSMGEKGAAQVMAHLDRNDVQHLSHKMAQLSSITQHEAEAVLGRFLSATKSNLVLHVLHALIYKKPSILHWEIA